MMQEEKYGSLEENIACSYGHAGKEDGMHSRHHRRHQKHHRHESKRQRDYDRMDESIGMREYEMNR